MAARKRNRRGFTLIEVLLVLAIVGFLALIAVMATGGILDKAKKDTTKSVIAEVENAVDVYNLHVGHYPSEEEGGLNALLTKPTFETEAMGENWQGPYLKKEPKDAWNRPLHCEIQQSTGSATEAAGPKVHIWSDGPDGQSGTEDDIKNWSDTTTGK
jgi:general secretion pathway protein G